MNPTSHGYQIRPPDRSHPTDSKHCPTVVPFPVARKFTPNKPNRVGWNLVNWTQPVPGQSLLCKTQNNGNDFRNFTFREKGQWNRHTALQAIYLSDCRREGFFLLLFLALLFQLVHFLLLFPFEVSCEATCFVWTKTPYFDLITVFVRSDCTVLARRHLTVSRVGCGITVFWSMILGITTFGLVLKTLKKHLKNL